MCTYLIFCAVLSHLFPRKGTLRTHFVLNCTSAFSGKKYDTLAQKKGYEFKSWESLEKYSLTVMNCWFYYIVTFCLCVCTLMNKCESAIQIHQCVCSVFQDTLDICQCLECILSLCT